MTQLVVTADFSLDGLTQQVATVCQGIGEGWYADVQLSPTNPTAVRVTGQAAVHVWSNAVEWVPLDVFDSAGYSNGLAVRIGSSLLLTAAPSGAVSGTATLTITNNGGGVTNATLAPGAAPFQYRFAEVGSHTVAVSYAEGDLETNAVLVVNAVSAVFPLREVVCVAGLARTFEAPLLPTNVVIEADAALELAVEPRAAGGTSLTVLSACDKPLGLLARLGEGGPVLDGARVTAVYGDRGAYWRVTDTYPDGSRLLMVKFQLGAVPPDIAVQLEIFVAGATFEDGSRLKTLTAADFDDAGVATYYIVQAANIASSICHRTAVFQGGNRISP